MSHALPSSLPRWFTFIGAGQGPWAVRSAGTLMGDALPPASRRLNETKGAADAPLRGVAWALAGITGKERYVEKHEKVSLLGILAGLGCAEATRAALIPVRNPPDRAYEDREVDLRMVREPD